MFLISTDYSKYPGKTQNSNFTHCEHMILLNVLTQRYGCNDNFEVNVLYELVGRNSSLEQHLNIMIKCYESQKPCPQCHIWTMYYFWFIYDIMDEWMNESQPQLMCEWMTWRLSLRTKHGKKKTKTKSYIYNKCNCRPISMSMSL